MRNFIFAFFIALSAVAANAEPVVKYTGAFEFPANGMHKKPVVGTWTLTVDGDLLTQVYMKSTAPVRGQTEFSSTEQTAVVKSTGPTTEMSLIYKLEGPTHEWSYVYVGESSDSGKTYSGVFYTAEGSVEQIKGELDSGDLSAWNNVGSGTLTEN